MFSTVSPNKLLIGWIGLLILLLTGCGNQKQTYSSAIEQQLDGEDLALIWTYEAEGPINASPLRVGEVVIIAPVGGPLTALDVATGNIRWQYQPSGKVWERSYVSDGERVFVGIEGGQLVALDIKDGTVAWQQDLGINAQMAPLVADDIIFVPTTFVGPNLQADPKGRAKLFALSAADGRVVWTFETDNYILQTPFRHGDRLYVAGSYQDHSIDVDEGGPMRLYALSTQDGSLHWVYESEDGLVKALYATDEIIAYIAYQDFVSGIDTQEGVLRWRKDTGNWVPSLSGAGDTVYFGSANTVVHAWDMNTGEPVWQHNLGGGSFNYLLGAPVRVLSDLYFMTQRGDIIALDAATGERLWQVETGIAGARDGLSVSGEWLFIGDGEGRVYAYANSEESP